jgi:hypothetical protein
VGLAIFLCLASLAMMLAAWQRERRLTPPLPNFRIVSFRCGIIVDILSLLLAMSCWIDPYPLARTADGGYSIAWLDLAWKAAFGTGLVSVTLALFGRGWPRLLLIVSGVVSLLLTYGSVLQNGV